MTTAPTRRTDQGFTLVELLVVIIVLGVLSAIAIPTFLRQGEKGYEAAVKADLKNLALAEEDHLGETGRYGSARTLALAGSGFRVSKGVTATVVWSTRDAFCLAALSTHGPRNPSGLGASLGLPYRAWFWSSAGGLEPEASNCASPVPSGATGLDGYWDSAGAH